MCTALNQNIPAGSLKEGFEEWEEGQNVKCRGTKNIKRFFSLDDLLLDILESVSTFWLYLFSAIYGIV